MNRKRSKDGGEPPSFVESIYFELVIKSALRGLVAALAELEYRVRTVRTVDDVPRAVGRTEHADVGLAVAVKIPGCWNIRR